MGYKPKGEIDPNANQDLAIEQIMDMFAVKIVPKEGLLDG